MQQKPLLPSIPPTFEEKYKDLLPYLRTLEERVNGLNNRLLKLEYLDEAQEKGNI